DPAGVLRGGQGRRGRRLAAVPERHAAVAPPHHVLRPGHADHPELQGARPDHGHDRRRARPQHAGAGPAHLPGGHPGGPVRLLVGDRAGAVPHRVHGDRRPVPHQRTEELLMTVLREAPPAARHGGSPAAPPAGGRRVFRWTAAYASLAAVTALVLLPLVWMISSSLKRNNQVFTIPIEWIPREFRWSNYVEIWEQIPMATYLANSAFLAVVITFLQVLTGSFAAYGFSKVRFPGRDGLFLAYIATIAVPWQAYMVPQYIMMQRADLTNTHLSIILLQAFGAFGVFLMRQYYMSIPDELCEAARIDGLSEYGIYRRIILPLSKPALASLALLTFVNTWNDYMG